MQDIWEPELQTKIDGFMSRKAQEFPELNLLNKWYEYEYRPKCRSFGDKRIHVTR